MTTEGKFSALMVIIAPEIYRKYVKMKNYVKHVLYVKLQKEIFGCLKIVIFFYKNIVDYFLGKYFEIHPYDFCVAKNMVNVKQMTVLWCVDYFMIYYADDSYETNILDLLL